MYPYTLHDRIEAWLTEHRIKAAIDYCDSVLPFIWVSAVAIGLYVVGAGLYVWARGS